MKISAADCLSEARKNPFRRYPKNADNRTRHGLIFSGLTPKFSLDVPSSVFTIGSCFARNIEEALGHIDVHIAARDCVVPKSEWPGKRPNGILNEYNPGAILQRVESALTGKPLGLETIVDTGRGSIDLLLPGAAPPVDRDRCIERRQEIADIYQHLASADFVIITLGLIETWYDNASDQYLNQMPKMRLVKANPGRFSFARLGTSESMSILDRTIRIMIEAGISRILLTVSPVPLLSTFIGQDCATANGFSKAVLRICAEQLCQTYPEVDYFPSYEIVISGGLDVFGPDQRHVKPEVVQQVTQHMIDGYVSA